jgi:hypothetical protein
VAPLGQHGSRSAGGTNTAAITTTTANPCVCSFTCRRGVALAKAGDLAGAEGCYAQALHLDAGNADALVARGAAAANQRQWQRASGGAAQRGGFRGAVFGCLLRLQRTFLQT